MVSPDALPNPTLKGRWDDNVTWEFYLSDRLPPQRLCTAVFCLAIVDETLPESIVLGRSKRGWETLGGHVDPGETVGKALVREAIEEGGFYPTNYQPFGYQRVTAKVPVVDDHHGGLYPTVGFIPHFVATTSRPLTEPSGEEILESRVFRVDRLPEVEASQAAIIHIGLAAFRGFGLGRESI